jgi:putative hemolysin
MTKTSYIIIGVVTIIGIGLLYWYFSKELTKIEVMPDELPTPTDIANEAPETRLPNPASVYCEEDLDGELMIVETSEGQVGVCHLPDGRWCEEWKLHWKNICVLPEGVSEAELYSKG